MTNGDLERFTGMLRGRQAEMCNAARGRDDIAIERASDSLDAVQQMGERESAIRDLDREARILRQIREALARVAAGSYGVCQHCDEEIALKRLNALPWAAFCIACQEKADRRQIEPEDLSDFFANAA